MISCYLLSLARLFVMIIRGIKWVMIDTEAGLKNCWSFDKSQGIVFGTVVVDKQ